MEIISRKEAKALGLARYFTGKPCKHGHISERSTKYGKCLVCDKNNQKAIRLRNSEDICARRRQRWANKREAISAERRAKYLNDREQILEKRAAFREKNREKLRLYIAKYRIKFPDKSRAFQSQSRAKRLKRLPCWWSCWDDFVIKEASDLQRRRRISTGIDWHIDHMIPLLSRSASGLHCAANIQVIPETMNRRKLNRMMLTEPGEWIRHL